MFETIYFAYGSNMNPDRMQERCPSATPLATAWLPDWRLRIGHRGVATIEPAESWITWGGLWNIATDEIPSLDAAEGVTAGYYQPREIDVHTVSGVRRARVCIEPFDRPGAPRPGYLQHLTIGAEYFELPAEHREYIASLVG